MPWMHKQLDKRKINSITLKFKGKERNSCLTSCKEKLGTTTTKVTKHIHKQNTSTTKS
jgi:hypothetical protein